MPKSTRCGACGNPAKGHAKRNNDKALKVKAKIRKYGRKRPV